jgi:dTDP-4-amino-4,6-dideoxygalactose transaminase
MLKFFDYSALYSTYHEEVQSALEEVGGNGQYIGGPLVREFERNLELFLDSSLHVISVANATDAMEAFLFIDKIQDPRVIVSTHTMQATISAIVSAGRVPVIVDVDVNGYLNQDMVNDLIRSGVRAVMVSQLNGVPDPISAKISTLSNAGVSVYEDSAQALGARFDGQPIGCLGTAGCFSFFPAKSLGCLGDGGAIVTRDPQLASAVRAFVNHGFDDDGRLTIMGRNSRLDSFHALFLSKRLVKFSNEIKRRREIAKIYDTGLSDCFVGKDPMSWCWSDKVYSTFQNYECRLPSRDTLREYLSTKCNIHTNLPWKGKALHQLDVNSDYVHGACPNGERYFREVIHLPLNQFITDLQVHSVIKAVREFYGR